MPSSANLSGDILFCVPSADVWLASARYRALLPAQALRRRGVIANVVEARLASTHIAAHRAIVMSKCFRPEDLRVAFEARRLGKPLFLDLCDNIFLPAYGENQGPLFANTFAAMANWSNAIIVTGPAMAEVVRAHVGGDMPIEVIPDQLETRADVVALLRDAPILAPQTTRAAARGVKQHGLAFINEHMRARSGGAAKTERDAAHKTLLWFGNHGAAHGDYGVRTLERLLPDLRQLDRDIHIRLRIMSNSRAAFDRTLSGSGLNADYLAWSPLAIYDALAGASVCLLPNSGDAFSRTKSANRAVLALGAGVPVVADDFPALAPLKSCISFDGWLEGVRAYLRDDAKRMQDLACAAAILESTYASDVIARRWAELTTA